MTRLQSLMLAGALALAGGAAHAFTFTDQNGNAGEGQGYVDLDTRNVTRGELPASRFDGGKSTMKSGNTTFQFSGPSGSFDQRYNPSNLFDPYARDGR